jgi:hypothetical protein
MGVGISVQSNTTKSIINLYNSVINQVTSAAVAKSKFETSNANEVNVYACVTPSGIQCSNCIVASVDVEQSINVRATLSTTDSQQVVNNMKNDLVTQLATQISQTTIAGAPAWFSAAFNVNINNVDETTNVVNKIVNQAFSTSEADCAALFLASNTGTVVACGTSGPVVVNQSIAVSAIDSCVNNQITNTILSNSVYTQGIQNANQQSQTGDTSLTFKTILIIILIVVFIITIFQLVSGGRRTTPQGPPPGPYRGPPPGQFRGPPRGPTPGQFRGPPRGPPPGQFRGSPRGTYRELPREKIPSGYRLPTYTKIR